MEITDPPDLSWLHHKKPLDTRTVSVQGLTQDKYRESKKPIYRSDAVSRH